MEASLPVAGLSPVKGSLQVYCGFRCPAWQRANYQGGFILRVAFLNLPNNTALAVFKVKAKFFF